jgi:hypothetical protein
MRTLLKNPEQTFTVRESDVPGVDNGDPDVTYTLRLVTRTAAKAIGQRRTEKKLDPQSRRFVDVVNTEDIDLDLIDYAIVDWAGIVSDGIVVPCDAESKRAFAEQNLGISRALVSLACETPRAEEERAASFR